MHVDHMHSPFHALASTSGLLFYADRVSNHQDASFFGCRYGRLNCFIWRCENGHIIPFERSGSSGSSRPAARRGSGGVALVLERQTAAGVIADCAHRTKGDRNAFKTCQTGERATSTFADNGSRDVSPTCAPATCAGARLRARLVNVGSSRGAGRPRVRLTGMRCA